MDYSAGSGTLSLILSGGGLGTGLTGVGIPVAISLGAIGAVCALVSVTTGCLAKVVSKKVTKHEKTLSVCYAKLNTINKTSTKVH